jgi:PPOX class probable F420-dependent enzyme
MTTMAAISEKYADLLQNKKAFASLATVMPDGTPQVTPVWFDHKDGVIRVNTAKGRVKARNMSEGAPVALSIMDPENAYRYLQIRGRVRRVTDHGADAHIDSLAKKYLGKDKYPFAQPGEVRVMYEIEPTSTSGMG